MLIIKLYLYLKIKINSLNKKFRIGILPAKFNFSPLYWYATHFIFLTIYYTNKLLFTGLSLGKILFFLFSLYFLYSNSDIIAIAENIIYAKIIVWLKKKDYIFIFTEIV